MSFDAPWGLALLACAGVVWWLHRRAQPAGERVFSAFFLLDDAGGAGGQGPRVRAPILLALRVLAVVALAWVVAGPALAPGGGTVVLADGPFTPDARWPRPLRVIRAGTPPTEHEGAPETVVAVAGRPDWSGAWLLAHQSAPGAEIRRMDRVLPDTRIRGGGATLWGDAVWVSVATAGPGAPSLVRGDGARTPLEPRHGVHVLAGAVPPGAAWVEAGDDAPWPLCVPDAAPLTVADAGWPVEVAAALSALGGVRIAPVAEAAWRVGPALPAAAGDQVFAPRRTHFVFGAGAGTEHGAAALRFAADLPPPGAVVRRWRALDGQGEPLLLADSAVVVDRLRGPEGDTIRFGFDPADTDLPETAGWPVLFADLIDDARARQVRCRTHEAGTPFVVALAPATVLAVRPPAGPTRSVTADARGLAVVDGLDQRGIYTLSASGGAAAEAALAVVSPPPEAALDATSAPLWDAAVDGGATDRAIAGFRRWIAGFAVLVLLAAGVVSRRPAAPLVWLSAALALVAAWGPHAGRGPPGPVILAVDVSDSMPPEALRRAVEAATAALQAAGQAGARVEGAGGVRQVAGAATGVEVGGDSTRHGPLLGAAARLATAAGAVVLLTDGRALDGPVPSAAPVMVVPVVGEGPDARVLSATAIALGEQVFVQALIGADRPVTASARLGSASLALRLDATPQTVRAVMPRAELIGPDRAPLRALRVSVAVEDDRLPANDVLEVPLDDPGERDAVAVGAAAATWLGAAGLDVVSVSAEVLAEQGARFAQTRALAIHDVSAEQLPVEVQARLRRFVEAGGLLLLSGREAAFGPGGWAGTPLAELSPLRMDPRPAGTGRLAVVVLLDRSGSMAEDAGGVGAAGVGRLAAGLASALQPEDQLGIVAFAGDAEVLLAPVPLSRLAASALRVPAVARGGTRLAPALATAAELLGQAAAEARVVVIISDGQFADAGEAATLQAATARLKASGTKVISVLVGADPVHTTLKVLAEATGGTVQRAGRQHGVLELSQAGVLGAAAAEGLLAGSGATVPEAGWAARVGGPAPPVAGRVRVSARPEARVLARVEGEPLLAEWAVGEGRVVALATDAWALTSAQWAGLLAPATAPRPALARLIAETRGVRWLGAPDDPPPAGPLLLTDAAGAEHRADLIPGAPGEAFAVWPEGLGTGPAVLQASVATARGPLVTRLARPLSAELAATGVWAEGVRAQAELTGGALITAAQAGRALALRRPGEGRPLAPWLALLALLAALAETARWAGAGRAGRRRPGAPRV